MPIKVEVSHAVKMLPAVWQLTELSKIANYACKAGLSLSQETESDPTEPAKGEPVQPSEHECEPAQAWEPLLEWGDIVLAGIELIDYVKSGNCFVAAKEINSDNTVNSVCDMGNAAEGSDSRQGDKLPHTTAEVLKSIDYRHYTTAQESQKEAVEAIRAYECCVLPTLTRVD